MVKHRDIPKKPAIIFDTKPLCQHMKAGKYFWCACGRTKKHPWCDGSHFKTGIRPVRVLLEIDQDVKWCACKQTKTPPWCDGSHQDISDEQLAANKKIQ